jgi:hypothetical protein
MYAKIMLAALALLGLLLSVCVMRDAHRISAIEYRIDHCQTCDKIMDGE